MRTGNECLTSLFDRLNLTDDGFVFLPVQAFTTTTATAAATAWPTARRAPLLPAAARARSVPTHGGRLLLLHPAAGRTSAVEERSSSSE